VEFKCADNLAQILLKWSSNY